MAVSQVLPCICYFFHKEKTVGIGRFLLEDCEVKIGITRFLLEYCEVKIVIGRVLLGPRGKEGMAGKERWGMRANHSTQEDC